MGFKLGSTHFPSHMAENIKPRQGGSFGSWFD